GVRGELVLDPGDACPELPDQTESQTPWGHLLVLVHESKWRPIKRARLAHRFRCYSSRCRPGLSIPIDDGSSGLRRKGARKGQGGRKNQMRGSQPITATVSHGLTLAVLTAEPQPVVIPQPRKQAVASGRSSSILTSD